jgi:hypothetical protein
MPIMKCSTLSEMSYIKSQILIQFSLNQVEKDSIDYSFFNIITRTPPHYQLIPNKLPNLMNFPPFILSPIQPQIS